MKQIILVLALIYFAYCQDKDGPALNVEIRETEYSCDDYAVYDNEGDFEDRQDIGVSDCVDLKLYSLIRRKYYDKCCYIRFLQDGVMHGGCIGLFRDQVIDIPETIKRIENGDKNTWTSASLNSKVYDLDCKASYIQVFVLVFALFNLLF